MIDVWKKGLAAAGFFVFAFLSISQSDNVVNYIAEVKQERQSASGPSAQIAFKEGALSVDPAKLSKADRELYDTIVKEAKKHRIEPIDAKVDPVWKAIPGLNGREVDIERTFRSAVAQERRDQITYWYREVPPRVNLKDLGAQPIYKGNPRKPMISLMINVAWKEENIPGMLKTLKDANVKATFFFLGSWLKEHPEVAKQIAAEGHEVSNHAYWHRTPLSQLPDGKVRKEIEETQQLIKETLEVENTLFAPPSGDYNMKTVRIAHELGLQTVLWTLDTVDWKEPPASSVVRKIAARMEPGAMILMHPTKAASGALPGIIEEARRQGYAVGTVSELLSPERVSVVETPPGF